VSRWIPYKENIVEIDSEKCRGCGSCVVICGGEVFELQDKKSEVVRMEQCLECGNCEIACPFDAIKFHIPEGGTGIVYECG
jgi:NAD-dependent dihydropyrimidine dehydrogenase PreA subunit